MATEANKIQGAAESNPTASAVGETRNGGVCLAAQLSTPLFFKKPVQRSADGGKFGSERRSAP